LRFWAPIPLGGTELKEAGAPNGVDSIVTTAPRRGG
jgi:hypothetical protein